MCHDITSREFRVLVRQSISAQLAQSGEDVLGELGQEAFLIVPGSVEHEMVEPGIKVGLDADKSLVRVGRDDPPLGDLLDGKLVGQTLHFDGRADAVFLFRGQR